jgi:hypothetical protein
MNNFLSLTLFHIYDEEAYTPLGKMVINFKMLFLSPVRIKYKAREASQCLQKKKEKKKFLPEVCVCVFDMLCADTYLKRINFVS